MSDDDALMQELKQALARSAPGSDAVLEAGRSAYTWRTVDEELARLTYDSVLDDGALVRSTGSARNLVFEGDHLSVAVDILPRRIVGQLVPAVRGDVVVQSRTGEVARGTADAYGCFTVDVGSTSDPLLRLRCTTASRTVVTDWISI